MAHSLRAQSYHGSEDLVAGVGVTGRVAPAVRKQRERKEAGVHCLN